VGDLIGNATNGYFQVAAIVSDTSLTLAAAPATAFSTSSFEITNPSAGTGTVSSSNTTLTGIGTLFLSQVAVGDMIGNTTSGYIQVTAIAGDTSLTLAAAPATAFSGSSFNIIDNVLINNANVNATSFTPASALTPGHSYMWWVGASSNNGTVFWSAVQSFTLLPLAAPTALTPSGTIAASAGFDLPKFTWSSVSAAAHYDIWVNDLTSGQSQVLRNSSASGTAWSTPSALTPGHAYEWWAGAVSNNGTEFWSVGQSFALAPLPAPTLGGPNGTIASTFPTFTWSSVTAAASYDFYLYDNSTKLVIDNGGVGAATTWTPSVGLTVGHSYSWFVAAVSTNGTLFWSTDETFTVT
jgi:hypothetical protein